MTTPTHTPATIAALIEGQRTAHRAAGPLSARERIDRLDRVIGLLVDHATDIVDAVQADFGSRSADFSRLTEVVAPLQALKHARANVEDWMQASLRPSPRGQARVDWVPKGVVGIVSPWNFPVHLAFLPLAGVLAAGNRALIKPSEFTPASAALIERLVTAAFDPVDLAVVTGDQAVAEDFCRQPFDHLLFTGATSVGRQVMRAAAEHLVPLTLELGGKSPVLVSRSADLAGAAHKILAGKLHNAGQACVAPDYVFVPEESLDAFVEAARQAVIHLYPTLRDNPDYTAIVNERHHARLRRHLDDARERGARTVELNPAGENLAEASNRKLAPTLVLDVDDQMSIMQDEIFGPWLPVKTYRHIDEALAYVDARPRPLALYYFGQDGAEEAEVLARTCSGGVTVNDVVRHVGVEDLPFGGVGASGMGAYHGHDGFRTFSHARAVYRAPAKDIDLLSPPYTERGQQIVASLLTR